jgi:hypothetical protein
MGSSITEINEYSKYTKHEIQGDPLAFEMLLALDFTALHERYAEPRTVGAGALHHPLPAPRMNIVLSTCIFFPPCSSTPA